MAPVFVFSHVHLQSAGVNDHTSKSNFSWTKTSALPEVVMRESVVQMCLYCVHFIFTREMFSQLCIWLHESTTIYQTAAFHRQLLLHWFSRNVATWEDVGLSVWFIFRMPLASACWILLLLTGFFLFFARVSQWTCCWHRPEHSQELDRTEFWWGRTYLGVTHVF